MSPHRYFFQNNFANSDSGCGRDRRAALGPCCRRRSLERPSSKLEWPCLALLSLKGAASRKAAAAAAAAAEWRKQQQHWRRQQQGVPIIRARYSCTRYHPAQLSVIPCILILDTPAAAAICAASIRFRSCRSLHSICGFGQCERMNLVLVKSQLLLLSLQE